MVSVKTKKTIRQVEMMLVSKVAPVRATGGARNNLKIYIEEGTHTYTPTRKRGLYFTQE